MSRWASAVYNLLCWFRRRFGRAFPSIAKMADMLGCSARTIKRATRELALAGRIVKNPRYRSSTFYEVIIHEATSEVGAVSSNHQDSDVQVGTPALHQPATDAGEVRAPRCAHCGHRGDAPVDARGFAGSLALAPSGPQARAQLHREPDHAGAGDPQRHHGAPSPALPVHRAVSQQGRNQFSARMGKDLRPSSRRECPRYGPQVNTTALIPVVSGSDVAVQKTQHHPDDVAEIARKAAGFERLSEGDRRWVRELERSGTPREHIEAGVLVGRSRKMVSAANTGGSARVFSLRYFAGAIAEAPNWPAGYGEHARNWIRRKERRAV